MFFDQPMNAESDRMQRRAEIGVECADRLNLRRRRGLFELFRDEPGIVTAPDQRRESLFRHETGRPNVAEALADAFHKTNVPIPLKNEVIGKFRRQELNTRRSEALERLGHIL